MSSVKSLNDEVALAARNQFVKAGLTGDGSNCLLQFRIFLVC